MFVGFRGALLHYVHIHSISGNQHLVVTPEASERLSQSNIPHLSLTWSSLIKHTPGSGLLMLSRIYSRGTYSCLRSDFAGCRIGTLLQQSTETMTQISRPSSDMRKFRECLSKAKHIVILTGAGVSAESGVPTFRGAGGFWRKWKAQDLATPEAFKSNPSLVWEFYHYRREVMASKHPNPAHIAIADLEKRLKPQNRRVVVVTQNIDELHRVAGSENIIELHGNLFTTRCTKCGDVSRNKDSPICPALAGKGEPDPEVVDAKIPVDQLPRCKKGDCQGLLRPHVVWFGEGLDVEVLRQAQEELGTCDLCLVVGTSSVVYPAAMFAPEVSARGMPVAEFNIEETPCTSSFGFMFKGPAGENLPIALAPHESEPGSH